MNLSPTQIDHLVHELKKHRSIAAAYLLGSVLTTSFRNDSDVDLAILLMPGKKMHLLKRLELAADLEMHLGLPVDISVLSTRDLIYAKEAVVRGRCIFSRDSAFKNLFSATVLSLYVQLRRQRKEVEDAYSA